MTSAHFDRLASVLQAELAPAHTSIDVAVAWFTDPRLYRVVVAKARDRVRVRVVVRADDVNFGAPGPGRVDWQELLDAGGELFVSPASPPLHHKFCVVDARRVLSGSYNWTRAARANRENVVVCDQEAVAKAFVGEFHALLQEAAAVTNLTDLIASVPAAVGAPQQETALGPEAEGQPVGVLLYESLVKDAEAALFQQRYPEALATVEQAIALAPAQSDGYEVLTTALFRAGRFVECVGRAQQAEERGAGNPNVWNMAGLAHLGLEQYKEATTAFNRCIGDEPEASIWYVNKWHALKATNRGESAKKAATDGRQKASQEIRDFNDGQHDDQLVRAYLIQATLRAPEQAEARRSDALAAQAVYDRMPPEQQDLHDLDIIKSFLHSKEGLRRRERSH